MINGMDVLSTSQSSILKATSASSNMKLNRGDEALMEACQEFESIFIKQMLSSMKKSVDKSGMINGGMTENIFEDWLYDDYASKMSQTGDFGLAQSMFDQMKAMESYSQTIASAPQSQGSLNLIG